MSSLSGRTVALCVSGSIAAYKGVEVARLCVKAGARVVPVMTRGATRFVGPVTLSGITGEPVLLEMFDPSFPGEVHVSLAARADVVAIVPATADLLARLASGRADDLVTALVLCARGPVVAAPAMHPRMWEHPATQKNVAELVRQGQLTFVGPVFGAVASGESGVGRMAEPAEIFGALVAAVDGVVRQARAIDGPPATSVSGVAPRAAADLGGVRVVVTAGPTYEDVDPVRFLGNRSSGKMGFAVAERAAARGAEVTLVSGPVERATPTGVRRIDVRSARDMQAALDSVLGADLTGADALIMAAAVADYRPAAPSPKKLKKTGEHTDVALVRNPDLLAEIGARRAGKKKPILVGFALETGAGVVAYARAKLGAKKVDLVVANEASEALGGDTNRATIVSAAGDEDLGLQSKSALADVILDRVRDLHHGG